MNEDKDFSLEVIHGEERNITDADEIAEVVTEHFRKQFELKEGEEKADADLSLFLEAGDRIGFMEMSSKLNIPPDVSERTFDGMKDKEVSEECHLESQTLEGYTPTYEEYRDLTPNQQGDPLE